MVYNSYTSKDVKHLVAYLAEHNRDGKYRRGNKIYQHLVENPKEWPWSKNHTWQSWRDHFVKNEIMLNKKIKKYQREHGILTGVTVQEIKTEDKKATETDATDFQRRLAQEEEEEEEPVNSVKKESVTSRKRVGGTGHNLSAGDQKRQKVMTEDVKPRPSLPQEGSNMFLVAGYPDPDVEGAEDRREVNQMLAFDKRTGSASTSGKVFARQADSSTARRVSALARKVPVSSLSDDSLNSLFDADSDILVPDSDQEPDVPLPGRVQHHNQQEDDFFQSDASISAGSVDNFQRRRQPSTLVKGPFKPVHTRKVSRRSKIGQDVELEPGVAEVTSPRPPIRTATQSPSSIKDQKGQSRKHLHAKYDSNDEQAVVDDVVGVDADQRHEYNHFHIESDTGPRSTPQHQLPADVKLKSSPAFSESRTARSVGSRTSREGMGDDSGSSNDQDPTCTQSYRVGYPEQSTSENSRTMSQASQNRKYVDLHEEGQRRHVSRRPSDDRSARASSIFSMSHSRQSPMSIQLSTQDQSLVTTLGIQQAVTMMSKNHGFTEDVVARILENVSSIPRTDEILKEMRLKAEETALNHLLSNGPRGQHSSKQTRSKSSKPHQKLEIRAMSDDEMSDYSPPSKTRAGQFSRLAEQGRREEAYAREARRASGAGHVPNNSNTPSGKPGSRAGPKAVEDGVFLVEKIVAEVVQDTVQDAPDLRDAHSAMTPIYEQYESKLSPLRALQQFQQTARIVKQILIDHQGHS